MKTVNEVYFINRLTYIKRAYLLTETGFATVSVLVSTVLTDFLVLQQPSDFTLDTLVALEEQDFVSAALVAFEAQHPSSETFVAFAEDVLLQEASVFDALSPHFANDGDVIPNDRPKTTARAIRFFIGFPF